MKDNIPSAVVKPEVYNKMLDSAIVLRNYIRSKSESHGEVTEEEANFVNDFEAYCKELVDVLKDQED